MSATARKTSKGRTIIDITQLVHWGGRLTGIPRVMNELSLRYAQHPEIVFVVWDKKADCFFELDIKKSLELRGQGIFYRKDAAVSTLEVESIQEGPQEKVVRVLKKATRGLKKYSPELYTKVASRLNQQIRESAGRQIDLEKGDMLVVLWGEWADETYRLNLVTAKEAGILLVNVVYDMLPVLTPQYSGHSTQAMFDYYSEVIPLSDLVLAISESTKRDLTKWLKGRKLSVPAIETFRLGDDFALSEPEKPHDEVFLRNFKKNSTFILCVGTIEARKNHTLLYYTYKLAAERGEELPMLVVVGRRGWKTDDIFDIMSTDPEMTDKIIFLQGTSDEELSWLYRNCAFTIYASFYEGWGLPIAESIAYGKPCLSSNTSSMPEVAGDLVGYFSPFSSEECLEQIKKLLVKKELDAAISRIRNYKTTSWDTTYAQVAKSIKELHAKA